MSVDIETADIETVEIETVDIETVDIETVTAETVVDVPTTVSLTTTAAAKVRELLASEGRDDLRLRIAVQPGGCSGMQYQLFFDERFLDGDTEIDQDGVPLIVDRMSAPYLGGAQISYTDTIEKQGFEIDNPNAGGGCACGNSFCG